jgi:hypothetical protein
MRGLLCVLISIASTASTACGIFSSEDTGDDVPEPLGGSRTVEGTVVDFESGQPVAGAASISTSGIVNRELTISAQGAAFTIEGVPENSAFQILASAPAHKPTFSEAVIVGESDLRDVKVSSVSDTFVTALGTAFGVTPRAERGILLARVVDDRGQPKAGVAKANIMIDASVTGPFFLGPNKEPLPNATSTSTSGWVVWFEVTPGVAKLVMNAGATVTLDMPISPVNGGSVTLTQISAIDGAPKLPTNVSFATQIVPIFGRLSEGGRGCAACHSGNGIGKDLGGLTLDGGSPKIYKELREEDPARVQLLMAEKSELLTYPSREDPPDRHPNVTFTGPLDPDYLKILVWIKEGAKDN